MKKNSFNSFVTKKLSLLKLKNSFDFSFNLLLKLKNSFSFSNNSFDSFGRYEPPWAECPGNKIISFLCPIFGKKCPLYSDFCPEIHSLVIFISINDNIWQFWTEFQVLFRKNRQWLQFSPIRKFVLPDLNLGFRCRALLPNYVFPFQKFFAFR